MGCCCGKMKVVDSSDEVKPDEEAKKTITSEPGKVAETEHKDLKPDENVLEEDTNNNPTPITNNKKTPNKTQIERENTQLTQSKDQKVTKKKRHRRVRPAPTDRSVASEPENRLEEELLPVETKKVRRRIAKPTSEPDNNENQFGRVFTETINPLEDSLSKQKVEPRIEPEQDELAIRPSGRKNSIELDKLDPLGQTLANDDELLKDYYKQILREEKQRDELEKKIENDLRKEEQKKESNTKKVTVEDLDLDNEPVRIISDNEKSINERDIQPAETTNVQAQPESSHVDSNESQIVKSEPNNRLEQQRSETNLDKQIQIYDPHEIRMANEPEYKLKLEDEIDEWMNSIRTLTRNEKLTAYAMAKKKADLKNLADVCEYLANGPADNHQEKAWLVYVWITENIDYETDVLNGNYREHKHFADEDIYTFNKTDHYGYCALFEHMMRKLDIECKTVTGYSKGFTYVVGSKITQQNHAWNLIKLGFKWYFVDCTFGAGIIDDEHKFKKKFQPYYFRTPAIIFSETHFNEENQLLDNKLTLAEFEQNQANELEFHVLGLKCKTYHTCFINPLTNPFIIEYESKRDIIFTTKLTTLDGTQINNSIFNQSDFDISSNRFRNCFIVNIPEKGEDYVLHLFGKPKDERNRSSFAPLTKYLVVRQTDNQLDFNLIPKYNISFEFGIKLLSHFSTVIKTSSIPIRLEFFIPESTTSLFALVDRDENKIESFEITEDPDVSKTFVSVSIPEPNTTYRLNIYAKNKADMELLYSYVSTLTLIHESQVQVDQLQQSPDETNRLPDQDPDYPHDQNNF